MRFFNTEGPVRADIHYYLPPLTRWNLNEIIELIHQQKYFLLHAPRQTGKTSCLLALMEYLNNDGRYRALYANLESAQAAREDVERGMATICSVLGRSARFYLHDTRLIDWQQQYGAELPAEDRLTQMLEYWAQLDERPAVLLLDEVDALIGDTLISLLRQLRAGYTQRPAAFPHSIILCGVRDLRDYRIHARSEASPITGGSAFNIKAESLRLGDFTAAEVAALLTEHTTETGQVFTPEAIEQVWQLTQGQPWLVNALAYHVCFRLPAGRERSQSITITHINQAKEYLIINRVTHLDQLADKLREERVRRVIEPMLAGTVLDNVPDDDIQYLIDLGLCRMTTSGGLRIANPIYKEVLPRSLSFTPQASLPHIHPTWLNSDGSLNPEQLLKTFLIFWRQHGQPLLKSAPYHEIAPHLVLMAFLHRVVNGDGMLEREYAIGSGRMDLCLRYGAVTLGIELKVWRENEKDPLTTGLEQLDGYLAGLGLDSGWLIIFDRRSGQLPIAERMNHGEQFSQHGRRIVVIRA
ncbi:AAA-like domain-containing protein [Thiospirillum jenense]|uniref:AAA-like domain-containing protein n=1 Tax=Thiospirillum jenense TaxID=1653858 RepID=A0A839HDC6_9GAMM|nr:AAA-like domain-containing protein [Thiospirillum jenense]MBB1125187.1 AAA-like domain-containing protein [Thiospirillum jenense]